MDEIFLETLYRKACGQLGWLSKLGHLMDWKPEELDYFEWLDRHEQFCRERLRTWERTVYDESAGEGFALYNELDDSRRLSWINRAISMLERQADEFTEESRFLFLGTSSIATLSKLRHAVRGRLLYAANPERGKGLNQHSIEIARKYPLSRLLEPIPKNKMMFCPFHIEKTPSFYVTDFGYCFGCGRWIDSIGWLILKGDLFKEAVRKLNLMG